MFLVTFLLLSNVVVFVIFLIFRRFLSGKKTRSLSSTTAKASETDGVITLRSFTLNDLLLYDGKNAKTDYKIYFAVSGKVFDVTRGKNFYGPDGPYGCFAGRDATIGLSRSDLKVFEGFKAGQVQEDPRELIEKLTKEERQTVNEWISLFESKYDHVGFLELEKQQ